jgi:hypothetical protein
MKRKLIFTLAILALFSFSCKKKTTESISYSESDYTRLKVGNYWVYKIYKVDTNGVETDQNKIDSTYILKDTVVRGWTYYISIAHPFPSTFPYEKSVLRDSAGYLLTLNNYGITTKIFSINNFTDFLFIDSTSSDVRKGRMTGKDSIVTVPAGIFTTRSFRIAISMIPNWSPWGTRYFYYIYDKQAGLIKKVYVFYAGDPDHYEARLIRYYVD